MSDLIRREDIANAVALLSQEFLDGGSPTAVRILNLAMDRIQALPAVTVQAQIDAERERADKAEAALRASVGGCDANEGWSHKPISIDGGKYFFCQDCGETLTKAVANRHSTAAAIRKGDQP
jgi:hypothetical protein